MRARYTGPSQTQGKSHPQSPPLHLHFDQSETFYVAAGKMGTTYGWEAQDRVWTSKDDPFEIVPWAPHRWVAVFLSSFLLSLTGVVLVVALQTWALRIQVLVFLHLGTEFGDGNCGTTDAIANTHTYI